MSQATPATGTGNIGKTRSPLVVFLLFFTIIYAFVYWYKSFQEMKDYSGEGVGGGLGLILAFCYVSYFLLPAEVGNLYQRDGRSKPVSGATAFWVFLPLLGSIIYLWKVQGALNEFWKSKGAK